MLGPRASDDRLPLACPARRPPLLDPGRRAHSRPAGAAMDRLTELDPARLARLQRVGILSGFAAGAWLGAAEAPTKLVMLGIPPVVISFMMVIGVFLARWSLPALVRGTAAVRDDVRQAPHLVLWAALAGCLWAVANTLTIFAIKDIGLAIAFPLWNANSLLGILWGTLLFNELRDAGGARWLGVWGGAAAMFAGATLLAVASSAQAPGGSALRGVAAALAAGALWGTMYIPYRKAYLTGMHPLSFVAFFTIGELGMMTALAVSFSSGPGALRAIGCWLRWRRRCSWGSLWSPGCPRWWSTGAGRRCSPSRWSDSSSWAAGRCGARHGLGEGGGDGLLRCGLVFVQPGQDLLDQSRARNEVAPLLHNVPLLVRRCA